MKQDLSKVQKEAGQGKRERKLVDGYITLRSRPSTWISNCNRWASHQGKGTRAMLSDVQTRMREMSKEDASTWISTCHACPGLSLPRDFECVYFLGDVVENLGICRGAATSVLCLQTDLDPTDHNPVASTCGIENLSAGRGARIPLDQRPLGPRRHSC